MDRVGLVTECVIRHKAVWRLLREWRKIHESVHGTRKTRMLQKQMFTHIVPTVRLILGRFKDLSVEWIQRLKTTVYKGHITFPSGILLCLMKLPMPFQGLWLPSVTRPVKSLTFWLFLQVFGNQSVWLENLRLPIFLNDPMAVDAFFFQWHGPHGKKVQSAGQILSTPPSLEHFSLFPVKFRDVGID